MKRNPKSLLGLLIATLMVSSCGVGTDTLNRRSAVPEAIRPYYVSFSGLLGYGPYQTFSFTELEGDTIGTCYTQKDHIAVDKEWWGAAPSHCREMLIYHEMGHCVLDLDHSDYGYMLPRLVCGNLQKYQEVKPDWIVALFEGHFSGVALSPEYPLPDEIN